MHSGPGPFLRALLTAGLLALVTGSSLGAQSGDPVDRILAVVDDDPILQSDIDRWITLNPSLSRTSDSRPALERRLLDTLIEQRLRFHEVERYGFGDVPRTLVDAQMEQMESRWTSPEELEAVLASVGMTREDLRLRFERQLAVLTYVDELLGARVFVGLEEIQRHYDEVLGPELEDRGMEIPPLDEVREPIRELLRQERLNEELEEWTAELRGRADILDYFDRPERALPPRVGTVGE